MVATQMDLTECDREPIHIPGAIQPHGILLCVDKASQRVRHAAGDFARVIDYRQNPIGRSLSSIIGIDLTTLIAGHDLEGIGEALCVATRPSPIGELDIIVHSQGDLVLIEMEPSLADRPTAAKLFSVMRETSERLRATPSPELAFNLAARQVHQTTGFGRVLVYQFLPDGTGRVVGESRDPDMEPFLGHRFPAGDIPAQARQLYVRNVIRVIPDSSYEPMPLLSDDASAILDMSDCSLRSVSPVHVQYLRNMDVGASMSVSLIRDGALWGLIACHHPTPHLVPFETRETCKLLATNLMRHLAALEEREEAESQIQLSRGLQAIAAQIANSADVLTSLEALLPDIRQLMVADGVVTRCQGRMFSDGDVPPDDEVSALLDRLRPLVTEADGAFATDDVESLDPDRSWRGQVEGGLLYSGGDDDGALDLVWFRRRRQEVVEWAGNPDKAVSVDPRTGQLTPRTSFEVWRQTTKGLARPWSSPERSTAAKLALEIERATKRQRISLLRSELIHVSRVSAMGAMASTMAHELNQPLAAIANYASGVGRLLKARGADGIADSLKHLEATTAAANRAGQIVRRLRAMVGKKPPERRAVSTLQLIDEAIAVALPDAAIRGIRLSIACPEPAPDVTCDPVQVGQVLTNLMRNSADALASAADKHLKISVRDTGQGSAEFRLADTGDGLSEEQMITLFQPFTTTKANGMGLGLSICRTIIDNHGGKIWAERGKPKGATFAFTLPLAVAEAK